jgi:hypothetical protein
MTSKELRTIENPLKSLTKEQSQFKAKKTKKQ